MADRSTRSSRSARSLAAFGVLERPPAGVGEDDDVAAAVRRVRLACQQALALEPVEEPDHGCPVDSETTCRLLLGLRFVAVQEEQDRELADVDRTGGQVLGVQLLQGEERVLEQVAQPCPQLRPHFIVDDHAASLLLR